MHEMSIAESILDVVKDVAIKNSVNKVTIVHIRAGELRGLVSDILNYYFGFISKDTAAEGAALEIEVVPVKGKCEVCQNIFPVQEYKFVCPECQSENVSIFEGMELYVKDIEVS